MSGFDAQLRQNPSRLAGQQGILEAAFRLIVLAPPMT